MRTNEDFEKMTIKELFDEIMSMQLGDLWDGMSSKSLRGEKNIAEKVFADKMKSLGVEWD